MTIGGRRPAGSPGVAAADHLAGLFRGPARCGEVVAVRTGAALAVVGAGTCTRMIAIAERDAGATRTANTVLLSGAARPACGATVRIGGGVLQLDDHVHRIARFWRSGVSLLPIDDAALEELPIPGEHATGLAAATVQPVFTALVTGSDLAAAARSLVGRGPGSTPAGDDVLAGIALGLRITDRLSLLADLHAAITPDLHDRTTALSADLLRAALAGHVSTEVRALLLTLRPGIDPVRRRRATDAVLALGHTSGADLLLGLSHSLRVAHPVIAHGPGPRPTLPAQSRRMAAR